MLLLLLLLLLLLSPQIYNDPFLSFDNFRVASTEVPSQFGSSHHHFEGIVQESRLRL